MPYKNTGRTGVNVFTGRINSLDGRYKDVRVLTNINPMRLSHEHRQTIKQTIARIVGSDACVWLFGSRVDNSAKGGDIDLYIETNQTLPNRINTLCNLEGALVMALGDRKMDILLKDGRTADAPIFEIAKQTGVPL
jgi:predicted nucleotidyltransferase